MAKINEFWVVTYPNKNSTLTDILFKSDIKKMRLQFFGGLEAHEIEGIYEFGLESMRIAKKLLSKVNPHGLKSKNKFRK